MGYKSTCVKDFREILTFIMGFQDAKSNAVICIFPNRPPLPWQRNWDKMRYKLACVRDIREIFALIVDFGNSPFNAVDAFFPRPTPVAMATKFLLTKWPITRLALQIFAISLRLSLIFGMRRRMLKVAFLPNRPTLL